MRHTYFFLLVPLLLAACATQPQPQRATPSAAFAYTQSARVQVARARAVVERIHSPVVHEATLALDQAETSIAQAADKIETLQAQITEATVARDDAEQRAKDAQGATRFWRAAALKLTLLSIALGLWVFRKPILRLCGVPAL